ncbi:MAG TPA: hypothetical protein VE596_15880 [Gaiellaceae bacterium]|nr:hypothetical protein [Gaiellaceae bacterium]
MSGTLPSVIVAPVTSPDGPSLEGCFIKLGRANKHRQELETALGPALDAIREGVVTETTYDKHTDQFFVHVRYAPEIPPTISTIAGDVINNLRSALDYAAYQAVWRSQGTPWESSQFPIASSPSKFSKRDTETLGKLDPGFVTVIKSHQPFEEIDDYRSEGIASDLLEIVDLLNRNRALSRLRDLSNRDKHRLLVPRFARATGTSYSPRLIEGCAPKVAEAVTEGDLVPRADPIAVFGAFSEGYPHPKMEVDFRFRPRVGLGGFGDIEDVLDAMAAKVVRIVTEFEPLF